MLFRLALLFLLVLAPVARADAPPVASCIEQLDEPRVSELLAFTETSAREQRLGASLWFSGWMAFNVTNVSIGIWKATTADTRLSRDTWLMSTIGAAGFVVGATVLPLPGLYAYRRLQRLPAATLEQRREKLRQGVELLSRAAKGEDRNSNLLAHLGGLLFALASSSYIYFHNLHDDGRFLAAGIQLGAAVAGAEATLWSVPRRARRDLKTLRERACVERALPKQTRGLDAKLTLGLAPFHVRLGWSF